MPSIHWKDNSPEGIAREELIQQVLPAKPIIEEIMDGSFIITRAKLTKMLIEEIEVYKAFPKKGNYDLEKFNTRNSRECFMGQGFKANSSGFEGWTDYDLARYRKAVGTIQHPTWGDVTLLEIWGGDHFEKYTKMVKEVHRYCHHERKTRPPVKFWINPLHANRQSGTWDPHEDELWQEANRQHLIKIAHYIEIRDRMKKAKVENPMDLAIKEEDDPKPAKTIRRKF